MRSRWASRRLIVRTPPEQALARLQEGRGGLVAFERALEQFKLLREVEVVERAAHIVEPVRELGGALRVEHRGAFQLDPARLDRGGRLGRQRAAARLERNRR